MPGQAAVKKAAKLGHRQESSRSVTIWFQSRRAGVKQLCRSERSLPSLRELLVKTVPERKFLPADISILLPMRSRNGTQDGTAKFGGSTVLQRQLVGACHISAHTTRLPGVLPNHPQSWSELFNEKQDETAQTSASTVDCLFCIKA